MCEQCRVAHVSERPMQLSMFCSYTYHVPLPYLYLMMYILRSCMTLNLVDNECNHIPQTDCSQGTFYTVFVLCITIYTYYTSCILNVVPFGNYPTLNLHDLDITFQNHPVSKFTVTSLLTYSCGNVEDT